MNLPWISDSPEDSLPVSGFDTIPLEYEGVASEPVPLCFLRPSSRLNLLPPRLAELFSQANVSGDGWRIVLALNKL
jgi:hypothetical protein